MEGRQVLGRQLPGQREQGVLEVVAMGTWMLTKAREAVSSYSALLRSPGLISQAGSWFALSSTGRRVAPVPGAEQQCPSPVLQPIALPAHPVPGWPPSLAPASQKSTSSSRNWESKLHLRVLEGTGGWCHRRGICTSSAPGAHTGRKAACVRGRLHLQSAQSRVWACLWVHRYAKVSRASVCGGEG